MSKRLIMTSICLVVLVRSSDAASSVTITTPVAGTSYRPSVPITMNGTCVVSVGNTFNYIYLRVFDVDNVSVIFDDNAVTTTEGNSPNWKTPIDPLTGKSAALAPPPWSVGLGQVKDFAIKADLYSMTGANLDNKTTWLVVDYRQPNP